jgi:hypothetical protein
MKEAEGRSPGSIDAADIAAAERLAAQAEAELLAAERREAEVVDGDVVRETETQSIVDGVEASGPVETPVGSDAEAAVAVEERPAPKPSRRRTAAAKSPRAVKEPRPAREPREKKSVSKPKGTRKKVAVAADS